MRACQDYRIDHHPEEQGRIEFQAKFEVASLKFNFDHLGSLLSLIE
jgi:hypothetical protein